MRPSDFSEAVRRIASVSTPAEVFAALLGASEALAERTAILLVRGDRLQGWGASTAYPEDLRSSWRSRQWSATEGWWPSLLSLPAGEGSQAPTDDAPDLGLAARETWAISIHLADRPVAVLVAQADRSPVDRAQLTVLATVARIRLELDLLRRKLAAAQTREPDQQPPTPSVAVSVAAPSEPAPSEREPEPGTPEPDELEPVRRYARLIATDIRLYNEEAVAHGRRLGDLSSRLMDPMKQGRQTFLQRYAALGDQGLTILEDAYVQVLAGGETSLIHPTSG